MKQLDTVVFCYFPPPQLAPNQGKPIAKIMGRGWEVGKDETLCKEAGWVREVRKPEQGRMTVW